MSTAYDTLSTYSEEESPAAPPSSRKYVVATSVLLGVAGACLLGHTVSTSAHSATNPTFVPYNALDANPVMCHKQRDFNYADNADNVPDELRDRREYQAKLPMWDPRYTNGDKYQASFYNACYFAFRCCSTTSNRNGCYVSNGFGDACKGCLADEAPRMVKERCISWLNDPFILESGSEITNQVTQPNGWGIMDLYADNWVPDIDTNVEVEDDDSTAEDESLLVAAYSLDFSTMKNDPLTGDMGDQHFASCWTQYAGETAQAQDFANKCFEVLSWCNLLCPRDTPQTADHVMCKHCVLFGFEEGNWSGDVFSNQLNGDSVTKSMCGFFPDRCDCRYQPGVGGNDGAEVTDPSKGWAGYPIGWEFCPKVTMAAKYNSGMQASCRQCPDDYVAPEGDVESTCDIGCVWEDDGRGQLTQIKKLFPGSTGPENYFGSLEGQQAEQECLDDAEAFVVNMGGCSNDEFYAQEAQETRDIPGQRTDAENPMLGGAPLEGRTTSFQEAAALR